MHPIPADDGNGYTELKLQMFTNAYQPVAIFAKVNHQKNKKKQCKIWLLQKRVEWQLRWNGSTANILDRIVSPKRAPCRGKTEAEGRQGKQKKTSKKAKTVQNSTRLILNIFDRSKLPFATDFATGKWKRVKEHKMV